MVAGRCNGRDKFPLAPWLRPCLPLPAPTPAPTFPLAPTAPFNAGRASGTCWGLPRDTGHQGLSQGMPESGQIQGAVSLRAQGSASLTP